MSNIIILAAIILYLGMVVWIGVICSKKNSDVGDFYLGGRKLGPVVTAMSAEASDMSSYLLMGVPGLAYLTGLADATWTAIGLAGQRNPEQQSRLPRCGAAEKLRGLPVSWG